MNIFILSTDPIEAAQAHCDQHLHKMILESAQMLSTAAHKHLPHLFPHIYASAYQSHPCTIWTAQSFDHMYWLCKLACALNDIRFSVSNCAPHSSIQVIEIIEQEMLYLGFTPSLWNPPTDFVFAGFPHIACRSDLSITQKYQLYYQKKHQAWRLTSGRGMTYKGRPVPQFMQSILEG
jgi:hypothetical protein